LSPFCSKSKENPNIIKLIRQVDRTSNKLKQFIAVERLLDENNAVYVFMSVMLSATTDACAPSTRLQEVVGSVHGPASHFHNTPALK
jgi:hypothetical protein